MKVFAEREYLYDLVNLLQLILVPWDLEELAEDQVKEQEVGQGEKVCQEFPRPLKVERSGVIVV